MLHLYWTVTARIDALAEVPIGLPLGKEDTVLQVTVVIQCQGLGARS